MRRMGNVAVGFVQFIYGVCFFVASFGCLVYYIKFLKDWANTNGTQSPFIWLIVFSEIVVVPVSLIGPAVTWHRHHEALFAQVIYGPIIVVIVVAILASIIAAIVGRQSEE